MTEQNNALASRLRREKMLKITGTDGRARTGELNLPHGKVEIPTFMPVGTNGTVKGMSIKQLEECGYRLILGNTYHLASRPGKDALLKWNGLHNFMKWPYNILTDSGGFQMVSLCEFSKVTEEGVEWKSTVDGKRLMLRPEDSIGQQNIIGSDIIMALDDVVSAVSKDDERFKEATARTTRWLKRCIEAQKNKMQSSSLFGIVQGGLDLKLREQSVTDLCQLNLPGYAIGGLSGGESKDQFWRVVEFCSKRLPVNKPRYLMGVGYPEDLVVCVAFGIDLFDCVYPTRTARFGTALVPEGTIRIRQEKYSNDFGVIQEGCKCECCSRGFTRKYLHHNASHPTVLRLLTGHNLQYMWKLGEDMREAIRNSDYSSFVREFFYTQYTQFSKPVPTWIISALTSVGIRL